jgi:RHS repeat-associated protein
LQEFDEMLDQQDEPEDEILWDYLRGMGRQVIRRRQHTEEADTDLVHINDPQGSVKEDEDPSFPASTASGYVTTAEGEPLPLTQPTEENHIRFHGGFLEDKELSTSAGSNRGYLYRMGVRHYSPALGRFLQRDPVGNFRPPNPEYPLASNPYAYGFNQPLEFTDTSGRQACPVPGCAGYPSNCLTA